MKYLFIYLWKFIVILLWIVVCQILIKCFAIISMALESFWHFENRFHTYVKIIHWLAWEVEEQKLGIYTYREIYYKNFVFMIRGIKHTRTVTYKPDFEDLLNTKIFEMTKEEVYKNDKTS